MGDVEQLKEDGTGGYSAVVQGSRPYSVTVTDEGGNELDCYCSCPDNRGGWCKHTCAVLRHLLPSGGSSAPIRTSPMRTSPARTSYTPAVPMPMTPPKASSSRSDDSKLQELTTLLREYLTGRDGALLAKVACLVYKQCKEAREAAPVNPKRANALITPLVVFFGTQSIPHDPQLVSLDELVARTAAFVISFSRDSQQIASLRSALQQWKSSLAYGREITPLTDANETAERKGRNAATSLQLYRHLVNV